MICLFYLLFFMLSEQDNSQKISIYSTFWFIGLKIKLSNEPVDLDLTEIIQDFSDKGR
jgi:hypothetical protein